MQNIGNQRGMQMPPKQLVINKVCKQNIFKFCTCPRSRQKRILNTLMTPRITQLTSGGNFAPSNLWVLFNDACSRVRQNSKHPYEAKNGGSTQTMHKPYRVMFD
jgi:hypothetical protein